MASAQILGPGAAAALLALFALGCGNSSQGGTLPPPGGEAGSVCNPTYESGGCFTPVGQPAQKEICGPDGVWKILEACGADQYCMVVNDPGADGKLIAKCGGGGDSSVVDAAQNSDSQALPPDAAPVGDGGALSDGGGATPKDAEKTDSGVKDVGSQQDAGAQDAGAQDVGTPDAGAQDAGAQDAGTQDMGSGGGPFCGDGQCIVPESKSTCPQDCGSAAALPCGDESCGGGESAKTCPIDCGQGAGETWKCLESKCAAEKAACQADASCLGALNDVGVCICACGGVKQCQDNCVMKYLSNSKFLTLGTCGLKNCESSGGC